MNTPSLLRRLTCLLYESLLVAAILAIAVLAPLVMAGILFGLNAKGIVTLALIFAVLLFYFCWQWLRGGQTLPLKTWKMKIISESGGALRPEQALLRYLLAWVSTLLAGAGFLWAMIDRDRQFLHDRLSGTRIITTEASPIPPQGKPEKRAVSAARPKR